VLEHEARLAQSLMLTHLGHRSLGGVKLPSSVQMIVFGPAKCVDARPGPRPKTRL
jgi:hypothetical protein